MSQQPSEERKMDFSTLPRGAIGIKGLPVSRNTRLPSIRSPRDLTLGAQPKRTFMPKIPVRREKKPPVPEGSKMPLKTENTVAMNSKNMPLQNDRGRGRGRGKAQIIQTTGSVFGEGIAADPLSRKDKMRETYQKSDFIVPSKSTFIKKEKGEADVSDVSSKMDALFRDDFIDDGDDDEGENDCVTIFPPPKLVKKEVKVEAAPEPPATDFHLDIAKEMNFDVAKVAKFIKKEKGTEVEENKSAASTEVPSNEITNLLNSETPRMVLLQFPSCVTVPPKNEETQMEGYNKSTTSAESKAANSQKVDTTSLSSFPEGCVGKLQVLKSGKTRLIIGSYSFDLDSISDLHTKNHVVSIRTEGETGDLSVLGFVDQKLTFSPNLQSLLS